MIFIGKLKNGKESVTFKWNRVIRLKPQKGENVHASD